MEKQYCYFCGRVSELKFVKVDDREKAYCKYCRRVIAEKIKPKPYIPGGY